MSELCISVIDKNSTDPLIDSKLPKRGVVVEVFEDGHAYGKMELTHPMFRILKVPGASMAFGRQFLGGELSDHPAALHRQFHLNLDHQSIPAELADHLADNNRIQAFIVVGAELLQAIKTKRQSDIMSIGQPANVIG